MKKLSILLILFTLFSCSKNSNMAHKTTIFYNGVEYSSNHYTTEIDILPPNISNPDPSKNSVVVTMNTTETSGFVFTYYYTDRHSFSLLQNNANQFKSTFIGDIEFISNKLIGRAYDNKGNYILFKNL